MEKKYSKEKNLHKTILNLFNVKMLLVFFKLTPKSFSSTWALPLLFLFVFLAPSDSIGQVTLFQFNFENTTAVTINNTTAPAPTFAVNGVGTTAYNTASPCQGLRMYTADNWDAGDNYRFTVNTTGFANMTFSFCNRTDNTAIGTFFVRVSANGGGTWTTVLANYTPTTSNATLSTAVFPVAANNDGAVWIEIRKVTSPNDGRDYFIDAATLTGYRIPTITNFTPTNACAGEEVEITGTNFTGATAVNFNGVAATISSINTSVTPNIITAVVPSGITTGKITVTTPGGTATSVGDFTPAALNTAGNASSSPSLCINTALATAITHTTTGATGIQDNGVSGANGLPAGVSATWASNTITINGTPTAPGTFNYSIPLTGGCGTVNATGTITVNANVVTPSAIIISAGTEPTCQLTNGTTTTTYATTAANNTGFNWSLSDITAGSIDASTGVMTWANGFSGTVNIQVTANGCDGPTSQAIRPVTITPTVGTPTAVSVSSGIEPTCQLTNGTTTTTYATTATNSTGFNWSLSNGAAGSIGATTGVMTWANGFSGTVDIQVTANGCNGPSNQAIRTVSVTPNNTVGLASSTPTLCINSTLIDITHATTVATGIDTPVNLPAGVTASWAANTITISGTPTASGIFNYSIPLLGGCGNIAAIGTITVENPVDPAGTISGTTTVCQGQNGVAYSVPAIANATSYTWTLPSGATIASGANTNSITVDFSAAAISGDITVYGANSCGNGAVSAYTVTVDALPATAGTIIGTAAVCQGQTSVAFSVPVIANATGYVWTLPAGATIATGANTESITVDFSASAVSGNVTVYGTNACGNGIISANYAVTVNTLSIAPISISGTTTICEGNSTALTVNGGTVGTGGTIEWFTDSCGGTSAGIGNSITVSPTLTTTYYVRYNSTCNTTVCISETITVNPLPVAAATITGTASVCQGQNGVTYSVPAIANATDYIWTLPSGATIASGANTDSITVDYSVAATSGNITVLGRNACGDGVVSVLTITINPLPVAPGTITGTAIVCQGQNGVSYSVPAIDNATNYIWTLPSGATIATGANTNSITVDFSSIATSGILTVQGNNGCGNGVISANYPITVNIPSVTPTSISGTATICEGTSTTLTLVGGTQGTNATAQWFLGSCGGTSAGTGNSITVSPTITTTYYVRYSGDCNTTTCASVTVIVNPLPVAAGTISGPTAVCQGEESVNYSIPAIANATNYIWTLPAGASITSGANTNSITVDFDVTAISGNITVYGQNACGTGATATLAVTVNISPLIVSNYTATICSALTATVSPANGGGNIVPLATTYSWGLPITSGGITGATAQTGQASFSQTLTNTTGSQQTATYSVTAVTNGCSSSTFTVTVYVDPRPTVAVSPPLPLPICSGGTINLTPSNPNSVSGSIDYNWSRNIIAGVTGLTSGTGTISGILTNTTNAPQTVTFTITATSNAGCISIAPATVNVTVNPIPTVTVTNATQTICSDAAITAIGLTPAPNNVAGTTFSWNGGNNSNITGILAGSGTSITGTLVNSTNTIQTTTYTITASANGCNSVVATATITVKPKPTITATPATQEICGGSAIANIVPSSNLGSTFTWTSSNPAAGISNGSGTVISGILNNSTNSNISVNFSITTNYDGCTSNPVIIPVSVKPQPIINITNNAQTICNGTAMAGMTISNANIPALTGTSYSWTRTNTNLTGTGATNLTGTNYTTNPINAGTLTHIPGSTTTQTAIFTVTATNVNGCSNTATASVTVYAPLTVPVIGIPQQVCNTQTPAIIYMTTAVSGGSGTYSYQWQRTNTPATPASWTNVPTAGTGNTYQPPTTDYYYRLIVTDNNCTPAQSVTSSNTVYIDAIGGFDGLGGIIDNVSLSGISASPICNGSTVPAITASITHTFLSTVKFYSSINNSYITQTSGGPVGNTSGGIFPTTSYIFSSFTANNPTNATVASTITVTPRFNNSCNSVPATATIQIRPIPRVASITTTSSTICSGSSTSINVTGNITDASMTFNWEIVGSLPTGVTASSTSGNSGSIPSGNTFNLAIGLNNTSTITQPVTIRFTPNSNYSSVNCAGVSSDIIINVAPAVTGTITSNQTICSNTSPTQLALSSTTGLSLSLLWQSSTDGTNFTNITPSQTGSTYNPPALTQSTWYRVRLNSAATGSLTCTAFSNIVKITVNSITPGTISSSQTVCAPTSSAIALTGTVATVPVANTGSVITYQWESSIADCNSGFNPITTDNIANQNYTIPAGLNTTTYFRRKATSTLNGVACSEYSNCIVITPNNVTAGTLSTNQTICQNEIPAQLTLSGSTVGATYQWERSTTGCSGTWSTIPGETNNTFTPPALTVTTYYRVIVTSSLNSVACSVYSNCITITVNPTVNAGIIGSNQTICYGSNPMAFTGTIIAGGTYQWQNSTDGVNFNNIPAETNATYDENGSITQTTYYRRITFVTANGVTCQANSNVVTVSVNHITSAPVITGNQSACNAGGMTALSITTPATANGTISYRWQMSTTGCSGSWSDIVPVANGMNYTPPTLSATTYYRVRVLSTLNSVICSDVYSNCVEVIFIGKQWNGSAGTAWENDLNWTPNGVPNATNCVIIPDVPNKPIISGTNYEAFAHSLSILANSSLVINSSNNITVTDFVNVNPTANFTIQNNASLVQHNDSAVNTGHISYTRTTRPVTRWAYVYWGSPVVENVFSQIPSQFDLKYRWQSGTLDGAWMALSSVSPGQGFIARVRNIAPFSTGTGTIDFVYQGTPRNGVVTVPVDSFDSSSTGPGNTVLLANPYPSAIDAEKFLTYGVLPTNLPENNSELGGTLFFWTSVTLYNGAGPYNVLDYGSWNLSGGVGTAPSTDPSNMSLRPNGKIAAGQGFFAQAYADGNITFNNSMRVTNDNHQFFRTSNATTSSENSSENNRIWLNIYSNTTFRQMMVNYKAEATNGLDTYYDGVSFTNNEVNLYSILGDKSLAIQGRGLPFDENDVVPLGYKITNPGMYSIAVDELDGLFLGDQTIYLRDNLLGIDHNIKQSPYTFNAVAGTFENRFEIVYVTNTLGVNNPDNSNTQASIINNVIKVESSEFIKSVKIYDISGKLINRYKLTNVTRQFSDSFNYPNGIYIAEITLENDMVVKKKLIH